MNTQSLSEVTSLVLGLFGLTGSLGGFFFWYKSAVEKRYAAERAFSHIQASQQQLGEYIKLLDNQVETVDRTLIELKSFVIANNQALSIITAKLSDGNSIGWSRNLPPSDR